MRSLLFVLGGFHPGMGLERVWMPGIGGPFWINLTLGAIAISVASLYAKEFV